MKVSPSEALPIQSPELSGNSRGLLRKDASAIRKTLLDVPVDDLVAVAESCID